MRAIRAKQINEQRSGFFCFLNLCLVTFESELAHAAGAIKHQHYIDVLDCRRRTGEIHQDRGRRLALVIAGAGRPIVHCNDAARSIKD